MKLVIRFWIPYASYQKLTFRDHAKIAYMQRSFSIRQPGSRAPSATPSSSSTRSTCQSSPSTPRTCVNELRGSTASPISINDNTELDDQNDSSSYRTSREPPSRDRNCGCFFPIDWNNLYLQKYGKLTGDFGYRILHKRSISSNVTPSPTVPRHSFPDTRILTKINPTLNSRITPQ